MRKILLLLSIFIYVGQISKAHASFSRGKTYVLEIYYDSSFTTILSLDAETLVKNPSCKIVFFETGVGLEQFDSLVAAMEKYQPNSEKNNYSITYGFLIKDQKGNILASCFADAWGRTGYVNDQRAVFRAELGNWIRANLTEIFHLKDKAIWSPDGLKSGAAVQRDGH